MKPLVLTAAALCLAAFGSHAEDYVLHSFKKIPLTDQFWAEGGSFADFNHDGKGDVVIGPYWYEGPDFKKRHEYYPATTSFTRKKADGSDETVPGFEGGLGTKNTYSDNFFAFPYDFNGDGWADILIYGFPGKDASWYENPKGKDGHWERHVIFDVVDNESPAFVDITGDGKPEIICNSGGYFGYAQADWNRPAEKWTWHPISPKGNWQRFTHGLGVGDINGDGRPDILEKGGWWEQPASLTGDPVWTRHEENFGNGGAQMYAYDVNGDGLNDVITSIAAHQYGLAWFEQMRDAAGKISFRRHLFVNKEAGENPYGVHFSEPHAIDLVDIDGDGLKDIVTGKRFWAHGDHGDPEANEPAVLYWFQLVRHGKEAEFVPHLIDDNSGVGTQVVAGDINGDKLPDVVVGNKKGAFVFIHETKKVGKEEWEKAQPKRVAVPEGNRGTSPVSGSGPLQWPPGVLPLGKDGQALNLDFEDGTLRDWTSTGEAFKGQPYKGPIDPKRKFGQGKVANHQGDYWIGGYEILGDAPHGTLTSAPFKVTHPFAAFRLGGGAHAETRLELVRADTGEVFFTARGRNLETMFPVVVDLAAVKDKEIFIRLVDEHSSGWGHVNFDDFRFYEKRPILAETAQKAPPRQAPVVPTAKFAGLPPEQAAKEMTLPPGFSAKLFAGEPDARQPIAFAIDDRGRLWVAEAYSYPKRQPEGEGKDRILVFEDTDGDGRFNKRTVFMEGLNLVSGLEVGFGGVWVGAAPYLMFIPIADGDEPKPAGPPKILLDGWGYRDTHETLNTFTWGPDGWLYGCHGVFTPSNVGQPGAPDSERTPINAGIWRYHPTRHQFEVFAEGTSNPWGIDFNEYGQCIIEACVIPHLWHVIQGGHYHRQAGQHFNPNLYDDIKTIADHVHWIGDRGPHAGNGLSDAAGGGHAHAGLMVYQGDSWPAEYRGRAFMNNIHGARINMDVLEPKGSGFIGHHAPDFVVFNDSWSQIVNLQSDQDGSVYMIDWYDKNQCHNNDPAVHDRSNGRIFKIVYDGTKTTRVDLQKTPDDELVTLLLRRNEWLSRHARRILQERAAAGRLAANATQLLRDLLGLDGKTLMVKLTSEHHGVSSAEAQLRLMWALHAAGGLREADALKLTRHGDEHVRAWAVQLACENRAPSESTRKTFVELARTDVSPVVRLYLASAAQRIAPEQRWDIVSALNGHAEDAGDHNLPLMAWYAVESLVPADTGRALNLALGSKLPRVLQFTARRVAAIGTPDAHAAVVAALLRAPGDPQQLEMLAGIRDALKGARVTAVPKGWEQAQARLGASSNAEIRAATQTIALAFGSKSALATAHKTLADSGAAAAARGAALEALLDAKDAALPPLLNKLLADRELRGAALRGLAAFGDPGTPAAILAVYPALNEKEKREALGTLLSRAAFAKPLLAAMANGQVPARDLPADLARQLRGLGQPELNAQLEKLWGVARESSADKAKEITRYKKIVSSTVLAAPNPSRGRAVFERTCVQCHTLFDAGGKIGPDITGSNRADLDYLLHNILDPNAEIPNVYRASSISLKDDRLITGIIAQQDAQKITVTTATETLTLPRNEIRSIDQSDMSMMPEELLAPLTDAEVRDLIAYLRSPAQVPLPATASK